MSDNNAHPGVRSLLAKFESSQSPITSPPSRGRSPVGSDTPGSARQLSKVRASFVTVDGAIQSTPGSPLRKTSGRSDSSSIFGPQLNQEDVEARRQNISSPTPSGSLGSSQNGVLDQTANGAHQEEGSKVNAEPKETSNEEPAAPQKQAAHVAKEEPTVSSTASTGPRSSSDKPAAKTVTKRPSNINTARSNASSKPATTSASSGTMPSSNTTTKPLSAREMAKERSNLAHKSSRASLNPAAKTSSRTTRVSTPSQETSKRSPTNAQGPQPRTKSPTKPARLPASATAPTQASSAKLGSASSGDRTSTTASTLTRKPSSLKSAGAGQPRTNTGASTVRKQSSRPSLPTQAAKERPSSRASDVSVSKPVNEGFLARMMRPTESSRSKTHDKAEVKQVAKTTTTAKAPRLSTGKAPERHATQTKTKTAALRPQSEKSQAVNKGPAAQKEEVKRAQVPQESEKENVEKPPVAIPEEPAVEQSGDITVEQAEAEDPAAPATVDSAEKPSTEEPSTEKASESVKIEPAAETSPVPVAESSEPATEQVAAVAPTETAAPTETSTEAATQNETDAPAESDEKHDADTSAETVDQPSETPAVPDEKEVHNNLPEVDEHANGEKAIPKAPAEQPKGEPTDAPVVAATEDATPVVEQEQAPPSKPQDPEVIEVSSSAQAVEAEKSAEMSHPAAESAKGDVEPTNDAATPEPSKPAEEAPAQPSETKPDASDIDFASLTIN